MALQVSIAAAIGDLVSDWEGLEGNFCDIMFTFFF